MDSFGFWRASPGRPRRGSDSEAGAASPPDDCGLRSGMPVADDMACVVCLRSWFCGFVVSCCVVS